MIRQFSGLKRTKIVCTMGPASEASETLERLGEAGMDVARLNFSHGTHEEHGRTFRRLVEVGKRRGSAFGILQDLQGPKIRVGTLPAEGRPLRAGASVVFSTEKTPRQEDIPLTLASLHQDVKPGEHLLFDDGLLEVVVQRVEGRRIVTEVIHGGTLLSHKGLNLPGTALRIPALSKKDREDAMFGVQLGVDLIALSFVRAAKDVRELRRLLDAQGPRGKATRIIAKIEKQEAVECFDEILPWCDGVMVARGDLGVEMAAAQVPVIQKQLISACRTRGVPVIVATQMLDSMQRNPRPTRAEVSDVANAVIDHADAVMLSGETASGAFPVQSVQMMAEIIRQTESSSFDNVNPMEFAARRDVPHAIGLAVRSLVDSLGGAPVIVVSSTGRIASEISAFRPETSIYAYATDPSVVRSLRLVWGVEPMLFSKKMHVEGVMRFALDELRKKKILSSGTHAIVVTDAARSAWGSVDRIEVVQI